MEQMNELNADNTAQLHALNAFIKAQESFYSGDFKQAEKYIDYYHQSIDIDQFPRTDNRNERNVLISVVVVAYNTNEELLKCLESLSCQSDMRFEIIVVNNGKNERVLHELKARPVLHIQCPMNMILSEGRNIGVRYARGEIVAFLDDDAIADREFISSIVKAFRDYRIAALRGKVLPKELRDHHTAIRHYNPGDYPMPFIINTEGNSAFRRDLYTELGGMNALLFGHEGQELSFKLIQKYGLSSVIYWPNTIIYHDYVNANTNSEAKQVRHKLMNMYVEKKCPGIRSYRKKVKAQLSKKFIKPELVAPLKQHPAHAAAYVHSGIWPSPSPSSTFVTYNAAAMAEVMDSCYLFVQSGDKSSKVCEQYFDIQPPDDLYVFSIPTVLARLTKKWLYQNYKRRLRELAQKGLINAMITRRETLLPVLAPLQDEFHIPLLYETHDFYTDLSVRDDVESGEKERQQQLEREFIPRVKGVIGLQSAQIEWYKKYFPEQKFFLARTGLLKRYKPTDSGEFITYLGSWEPHKGVEVFLNALAKVKPCPRVLFVGGKTAREIDEFKSVVRQYLPLDRIVITGWVGKQELGKWMQRTAVGVLPLMPTFFNRYITSPLKLFDYYSYSIPVIASDLPTTRDLIEEEATGVFFKAGDADDLSQKIIQMLDDPERLNNMRYKVYEYAEQFLWQKRAKKLSDIICQVQIF